MKHLEQNSEGTLLTLILLQDLKPGHLFNAYTIVNECTHVPTLTIYFSTKHFTSYCNLLHSCKLNFMLVTM